MKAVYYKTFESKDTVTIPHSHSLYTCDLYNRHAVPCSRSQAKASDPLAQHPWTTPTRRRTSPSSTMPSASCAHQHVHLSSHCVSKPCHICASRHRQDPLPSRRPRSLDALQKPDPARAHLRHEALVPPRDQAQRHRALRAHRAPRAPRATSSPGVHVHPRGGWPGARHEARDVVHEVPRDALREERRVGGRRCACGHQRRGRRRRRRRRRGRARFGERAGLRVDLVEGLDG